MDIDKTEKQLKHIETLNMMSNFSISHFTLNKFEGMDGAMSWLAVIVVFIVIALPVLFCCSSCACCRTCGIGIIKGTWFGVKGSCCWSGSAQDFGPVSNRWRANFSPSPHRCNVYRCAEFQALRL